MSRERHRLCSHCSRYLPEERMAQHLLECPQRIRAPRPRLVPISEVTQQRIQSGNHWGEESKRNDRQDEANENDKTQQVINTRQQKKQAPNKPTSTSEQEASQSSEVQRIPESSQHSQDVVESRNDTIINLLQQLREPAPNRAYQQSEQSALLGRCTSCGEPTFVSSRVNPGTAICRTCRPYSNLQNQAPSQDEGSSSEEDSELFGFIIRVDRVVDREGEAVGGVPPDGNNEEHPQRGNQAQNTNLFQRNIRPPPHEQNQVNPERRPDTNPHQNPFAALQPGAIPARVIFVVDNFVRFLLIDINLTLESMFNPEEQGLDPESRNSLQRLSYEITEGESELCAICQHDFADNDELLKLRCHHQFHEVCLGPWLDRNTTCPLCKQDQNVYGHID